MSHHLDYPKEVDDVSDVYIFPGPSDDDGPRTVIAMNASPIVGAPWDPTTFYELKLDLNGDYVADITWRFTFTQPDANGNQHVTVAQLTGADATSRTAPGTIITPPNAPVGQVLHLPNNIKAFAGERLRDRGPEPQAAGAQAPVRRPDRRPGSPAAARSERHASHT